MMGNRQWRRTTGSRQHCGCGSKHGFSLAEMVVMAVLFSLLTLALAYVVSISMSFYRQSDTRMNATREARTAMSAMVNEMAEAEVCPDLGLGGNSPRGYMAIAPPVQPTGILDPNANSLTSTQLWLTRMAPGTNLFNAGVLPASPQYYQWARYYLQGSTLMRDLTTFDANGGIVSDASTPVVQATSQGRLVLTTTWESPHTVNIQVEADEGSYVYTLNSDATTL